MAMFFSFKIALTSIFCLYLHIDVARLPIWMFLLFEFVLFLTSNLSMELMLVDLFCLRFVPVRTSPPYMCFFSFLKYLKQTIYFLSPYNDSVCCFVVPKFSVS